MSDILTEEALNNMEKVIIRITSHDGANWYGDNDIGSYWEVVKECITTFQIKTDEPYRVGINKLHCEIISGSLPEKMLPEEELKERNRLLVLENDELNAENEMHVRYERYLVLLIDAGGKYVEEHDFEWFKQIWNDDVTKTLEELK